MSQAELKPVAVWAAEHTYTYYNSRRKNIEIVPVFAAQVPGPRDIKLTKEHSEFGWYAAEDCLDRIYFRGLKDGLKWTRKYISEASASPDALRIL